MLAESQEIPDEGFHLEKPDIETYVDLTSVPTNQSLQQLSTASITAPLNTIPSQEHNISQTQDISTSSKQQGTLHNDVSVQQSSQPLSSQIVQSNAVAIPTSLARPVSHQAVTIQSSSHNTVINNTIVAALAQLLQPNQTGSTNQISDCLLNTPLLQTHQPISSPLVTSRYPFDIKFLTPAIKVCAGCRSGYARAPDGKNYPAPHNLCLVHKEQHLYYNTVNVRQQLSSLSNVHYHANVKCPKIRFTNFDPRSVRIPDDVRAKLMEIHKKYLLETFGIC